MAINAFETRSLLQMLEVMLPSNTFLRDTFFNNTDKFTSEYVDIDIRKGLRRVAPFVNSKKGSITVERTGYKTETYRPELVSVDIPTTAEDLIKRSAGENIYGAASPNERMATILAQDLRELEDMITRREEVMCAEALFSGTCTMKGDGIDHQLDYGLTNVETLAGASRWSEPTSDPIADLRRWRRTIIQKCGLTPDIVVLGANALDKLISNEKIFKQLNLLNVELGKIDPKTLPNGVTYIGRLTVVGLDLYSYDEWYMDDKGKEQPIVPVDKVFVGVTTARRSMLYGAVVDASIGSFALPRVPKSWIQNKPSARFLQLSSRPLAVPHQIDAIFVAKVL